MIFSVKFQSKKKLKVSDVVYRNGFPVKSDVGDIRERWCDQGAYVSAESVGDAAAKIEKKYPGALIFSVEAIDREFIE